jgi:hypothetical protein
MKKSRQAKAQGKHESSPIAPSETPQADEPKVDGGVQSGTTKKMPGDMISTVSDSVQGTQAEQGITGSVEKSIELRILKLAFFGTSFEDAAKVIESADAARRKLRLEAARGSAEKFGDFRDTEKIAFRMLTTSAQTGIPTSAALKALLADPDFVEEVDKNFPRFVRRLHNFMRQKETHNPIKQRLVHGLRVVAYEGDNFGPRLRANRIAIVLPSLHSLICYAKHLSHLDVRQIPVNSCQPEMFSKRPRMRWNCFLNPPIHRNHRQTCFNRPTTNTQQCALKSGRFDSAHLARYVQIQRARGQTEVPASLVLPS